MSTQPEALRLADVARLSRHHEWHLQVDAELRRLSAENKLLHERHHDDNVEYTRVLAQRDALLKALKEITPSICHVSIVPEEKCAQCGRIARARAAIAKAEAK